MFFVSLFGILDIINEFGLFKRKKALAHLIVDVLKMF